ncbi:MAG: glycosyltransferase [Cucumibacter sp.]
MEACIGSFSRLESTELDDIVVVDFGSAKPIKLEQAGRRVRIIRVEATQWCLAEAINVGVVSSRNAVVAKTDADMIIGPDCGRMLDKTTQAISDRALQLAVSRTFDLPPEMDVQAAIAASSSSLRKAGLLRPRWGLGGLCLFAVETWNEIGGFDSRFVGWGNEDNDFSDRVRKSGARMRWINPTELRVYHISHEPRCVSQAAREVTARNRDLYLRDKSVYRQARFIHSRFKPLAKPNILAAHRPLVTVAIATRARTDRDRMLKESINSFVGQIDGDFEVLIADNGSSPAQHRRLRDALRPFQGRLNLRVFNTERPSIPHARNRLTEQAAGRYICIMDDDDIALPNRLSDHLAGFESEDGLHGSHGGWIDFDQATGHHEANVGRDRSLESMLFGKGKVSSHSASLYRTDVLRAVRYDESFVTGSDWDLALRMASLGLKVGHTQTYVTLRRWHTENVTFTRTAEQTENGRYARRRVVETLDHSQFSALKQAMEVRSGGPSCSNLSSDNELLSALPAYVGVWRLVVPVASLVAASTASPQNVPGSGILNGEHSLNGKGIQPGFDTIDGKVHSLISVNRPVTGQAGGRDAKKKWATPVGTVDIEQLLNGDVGVIDCGLNPSFFYISAPIRGASRALKLMAVVARKLNVPVKVIADVDLKQRQMAGFDWNKLRTREAGHRVISEPINSLDQALAALNHVPADTLPGALLTLIADAGEQGQVFFLASKAIADGEEAANIGRVLGQFTGEAFRDIGDGALANAGTVA